MKLARNTVSQALGRVKARRAGDGSTPKRRPRRLDSYETDLQELLARYPDLNAVRLLEELRQRGFTGGYTVVRQRLRELQPTTPGAPVQRFETGPGAQAQMDYAVYDLDFTSEGRRRVSLFSYLLGYSRRQYLRFVEAQDFTTTIREHVRAFAHLGGVAATCLYDNMKVVVTGYEDDVPIYNPRFLAFATHYGFRPVACRPRRPQTKGKVERRFAYVESSLLNGRTFETLNHLNETTAWWLTHVADVHAPRDLRKTPLELHEEERPSLIALPAQPYETDPVTYRTVNVEGMITYRQNGYSVPWRQIGSMLPVRVTESEVIVYNARVEEIARHALLPHTTTGQRSVQKEHRPAEDARQRQAQLEERFVELGATAVRFLEGLLQPAALCPGPCPTGAGTVGVVQPGGPDRRAGASRPLRRLFACGGGAHPVGPGAAQEHPGDVGRGRAATSPPLAGREAGSTPAHVGLPTPRRAGIPRPWRPKADIRQRPPATTPSPMELRRQILEAFQTLRIPLQPEQFDAVLARAEHEGLSHLELLRMLIGEQADQRRERRIAHRIREARFREGKTLAGFDWQFNAPPSIGHGSRRWRRRSSSAADENLVLVGQSGVGKSRIIEAIGHSACVRGYRVRYTTSADLLADLTAALADQTLPRRLREYAYYDLLIIDEFGFDRIERNEARQAASLLYKLIDARSPKRSTALVTNIDFEAWGEYLGDPPLAMAFLDRIVDGAIIVKINGKSYRHHRAQQASTGTPSSN